MLGPTGRTARRSLDGDSDGRGDGTSRDRLGGGGDLVRHAAYRGNHFHDVFQRAAGIRGVLNLAPTVLRLPPTVSIVGVDLTVQLEQLAFLVQGGGV